MGLPSTKHSYAKNLAFCLHSIPQAFAKERQIRRYTLFFTTQYKFP